MTKDQVRWYQRFGGYSNLVYYTKSKQAHADWLASGSEEVVYNLLLDPTRSEFPNYEETWFLGESETETEITKVMRTRRMMNHARGSLWVKK